MNPFHKKFGTPGSNRSHILSRGQVSTRGLMNKTEARYAEQLEALRHGGEIAAWWFEAIRLRVTDAKPGTQAVWYTPDFLILLPDGTTYIDDVKGPGPENDASLVRLKAASSKFTLWEFRKAKEGKRGQFEVKGI